MMVNQQVLDALKQIGLNLYERKLWASLLSRGTASAGELSSLAKVPHSRTYDVLESLADKGFVMIQNTKPLKYIAIKPAEAMERAKQKIRKDAEVSVDRIGHFQKSSVIKELERIHKKGVELVEPGEMSGSLRGKHMIQQQMDTIFKNAKKNISIMTTHRGVANLHVKHSESLRRAAKRGVKIRIATPHNKETQVAVLGLKKFSDIRKLSKPAGRMCVVDGKHAILSLTNDKNVHPTQDLGFWTESEHVAGESIGTMFEAVWKGLPAA